MNAERLMELYDRVSDAPDAIPRLRRFILDLAVRGKLVEQDPNDEPALKLLEKISSGTTRAPSANSNTSIEDRKKPFALPNGWVWTQIGQVCSKTGSGSTPRGGKQVYKTSGIPFLRSQNVYDHGLLLEDVAFIDATTHHRMAGTQVQPKDLLLNITGGSIGRCCLLPSDFGDANISQHVAIIRPTIASTAAFLHLLIRSPYFQCLVLANQTGAGRGGLPKNRMDQILVPLAPLAEQRRIVAKVDELMALCDRLEVEREKREATRDRLTTASLSRLTAQGVDEKQFKAHADFAIKVLPELTNRPDQIKVLRQMILDLAVRGKLVEQDPNDETISEYLRRLEESERERNNDDESPGDDSFCRLEESGDFPFELPGGWSWMRLGSLGALASSSRVHRKDWSDAGVPFYRAREIVKLSEAGEVENELFISEQLYQSLSQKGFVPECDDIMITGVGTIGIPYVVKSTDRFYFKDASVLIFKNKYGLDSQFLYWLMRSPYWVKQVHVGSMGTTVHTLTISRGKQLAVPIPPLPEQHRIVAKVDELIPLCDQLERDLNSGLTNRSGLMEALLVEALEPMTMEPA